MISLSFPHICASKKSQNETVDGETGTSFFTVLPVTLANEGRCKSALIDASHKRGIRFVAGQKRNQAVSGVVLQLSGQE